MRPFTVAPFHRPRRFLGHGLLLVESVRRSNHSCSASKLRPIVDEMDAWCRQEFVAGTWRRKYWVDYERERGSGQSYARSRASFHFDSPEAAFHFKLRWL